MAKSYLDQPASAPADDSDVPGQKPNVSPEEQKQYASVVEAGRSLYLAKTAQDALLQKLRAGGYQNIGKSIGHTVAMIALSVLRAAKSQGSVLELDMLEQAAREWLAELIEIAEAAKLSWPKNRDQIINQAYAVALPAFGNGMKDAGLITPQDRQMAQAHLKELLPQTQGEPA